MEQEFFHFSNLNEAARTLFSKTFYELCPVDDTDNNPQPWGVPWTWTYGMRTKLLGLGKNLADYQIRHLAAEFFEECELEIADVLAEEEKYSDCE